MATAYGVVSAHGGNSNASLAEAARIQKVVVIEDDPVCSGLCRIILEKEGEVIVLTSTTGRGGLKLVQDNLPDLVLLDLGLPDMDGVDVLLDIKSSEQHCDIPVVVFSATRDNAKVELVMGLGAKQFIQKPLQLPEMGKLIRGLLKKESVQ